MPSAATPDVHLRIIEDIETRQKALRIRLDRDRLRAQLRMVKSRIRQVSGNGANSYGLTLDDGWDQLAASRPLVVLVHGYGESRGIAGDDS